MVEFALFVENSDILISDNSDLKAEIPNVDEILDSQNNARVVKKVVSHDLYNCKVYGLCIEYTTLERSGFGYNL